MCQLYCICNLSARRYLDAAGSGDYHTLGVKQTAGLLTQRALQQARKARDHAPHEPCLDLACTASAAVPQGLADGPCPFLQAQAPLAPPVQGAVWRRIQVPIFLALSLLAGTGPPRTKH